MRGHLSEGRERYQAALSREGAARRTGARARALHGAGALAYRQGDYSAARSLYEESVAMARELGDRRGIAGALEGCAALAAVRGKEDRAARLWAAAERRRE